MQLEWLNHSCQLLEGVSDLFDSAELVDVTVTAEGRKIRAHRVILSAASTYFRVGFIYFQNLFE
jgi:broad-like protein